MANIVVPICNIFIDVKLFSNSICSDCHTDCSVLLCVCGCVFSVCSQCSIFTLGTYDKSPAYGRLASQVCY